MAYPEKIQKLFDKLTNIIDKENKEEEESDVIKEIGDNIDTEELIEYEECMICGDNLCSDKTVSIDISCGHRYHYDCIYSWWCKIKNGSIDKGKYQSRECPYCRKHCKLLPRIEGKDEMLNVNIGKLPKGCKTYADLNPNKCHATTCKGFQCKLGKKFGDFCGRHKTYQL